LDQIAKLDDPKSETTLSIHVIISEVSQLKWASSRSR